MLWLVFLWALLMCFFFQAEDGIRDAQESRGLGDVYKRQIYKRTLYQPYSVHISRSSSEIIAGITQKVSTVVNVLMSIAVSYTHLTLPTKRIV